MLKMLPRFAHLLRVFGSAGPAKHRPRHRRLASIVPKVRPAISVGRAVIADPTVPIEHAPALSANQFALCHHRAPLLAVTVESP
jgi:hypothetical protein